MKSIVNLYYQPNDQLKKKLEDPMYVPMNAGSLADDPWAKKHCNLCKSTPNINQRNNILNEVTSIWYAWMHQDEVFGDADIVGHQHYRRFFSKQSLESAFNQGCEIVVMKSIPMLFNVNGHVTYGNVADGYRICHVEEDWNKFEFMMMCDGLGYDKFNEWKSLSELVAPCNMFMMKRELFNEYCHFVMPRLLDLVNSIDTTGRDNYQKRAGAFLAERFTSLWIYTKRKEHKIGICPIEYHEDWKPTTAKDQRGNYEN